MAIIGYARVSTDGQLGIGMDEVFEFLLHCGRVHPDIQRFGDYIELFKEREVDAGILD
jgi:hypothetical protein